MKTISPKKSNLTPVASLMIIFIILLTASHSAAEETWQLYYDKKDIKAFKRQKNGSSFLETKGTTIINSRIEVISKILDDIAAYPEWMADCIDARLLETDENQRFLYVAQDVPWPVADRDVVIHAQIEDKWEQGKQTITLQSIADYPGVTLVKDRIRMDKMTGKWELEYIDREHTRVTYTVFSEPGGIIPAAIANTSVKNVASVSLVGLKRMVKKPEYIDLGNSSTQKQEIENAIQKGFLKLGTSLNGQIAKK